MSKLTVRKIYLYLVSFVGLILIVMGAVGLINLGIRLIFFPYQAMYGYAPPPEPSVLREIDLSKEKVELTPEQIQALDQWQKDYQTWQENMGRSYLIEPLPHNLSLLIVGLPLYLFHWNIIKKEEKKNLESIGQS